jgi:putative ABC transport system permease protein
MLGIIIGVAAVISMVSITEGAKENINREIEALGSNLLMVLPESPSSEEEKNAWARSRGLVYNDIFAISQIPHVKNVVPVITFRAKLKYLKNEYDAAIEGTNPAYQEVRDFRVETGRFISQRDIEERSQTVVIGKKVKQNLFREDDPIGKEIKIGRERFVVIGVMEEKEQVAFVDFDVKVFIPITTTMRRFTGTDAIDNIQVQVANREATESAMAGIEEVLLNQHRQIPDFRLVSQADILKTIEKTTKTFKLMLGGIAGISLLVGGIGIMNIMLVSVTERTREIGIRKAVGATKHDIMGQFLAESVTISFVGGTIGIILGIALGMALTLMARSFPDMGSLPLVISATSIAIGFLFSVTVGIFFGMYPARKAARLDPVDALRYE